MSYYEFTGKTVKEAVAKACQELDTDETLLEIEVLEESARGFLGIVGQRDARVRVTKRNILKEVVEADEEIFFEGEAIEETSPLPIEPDEAPEEPETAYEAIDQEAAPSAATFEAMEEARTVLQGILQRMPIEAEVHASLQGNAIYLDMKGDVSGILIGKKGQTLDALQFLVNKIINKNNPPGSKIEIIVDTENYRVRKTENLREMALKMSEKAKKTLKPVSLVPMPPNERRIVHLILAEEREVYTKSYGEGPLRRIIVYPRRAPLSKRRRR
ncbi:MAG: Jag N-terminal domain-containing protein [Deltaproteobacteria bacterium]|nr:Jag N-terminal domain-containing protein [Deltaproteobacteria bacterium]